MNKSSYPKNVNHNKDSNDHFNNNNGKGPDNHSHTVMKGDNNESDSDRSPYGRVEKRRSIWYIRRATPTQNGSGHETIFDDKNRIISKIYFEEKLINGVRKKALSKEEHYDVNGVIYKAERSDYSRIANDVFLYDDSAIFRSYPKPTFLGKGLWW
jgi:hypothetical protein